MSFCSRSHSPGSGFVPSFPRHLLPRSNRSFPPMPPVLIRRARVRPLHVRPRKQLDIPTSTSRSTSPACDRPDQLPGSRTSPASSPDCPQCFARVLRTPVPTYTSSVPGTRRWPTRRKHRRLQPQLPHTDGASRSGHSGQQSPHRRRQSECVPRLGLAAQLSQGLVGLRWALHPWHTRGEVERDYPSASSACLVQRAACF